MTFLPSVLSKIDSNNSFSGTASSFTGSSSSTIGFNQIQISLRIGVSTDPLGLKISFSSDGLAFTTMYSDTVLASSNYFRGFTVLNSYYKIQLTLPSSQSIELETRLATSNTTQRSYYEISEDGFYDAFSKLRVTMPYSILDLQFPSQTVASGTNLLVRNNNEIVCSKSVGSYSAVYQRAKVVISGTGTGSFISQSRQYALYQPGKSQLLLATGVIGNVGSGGTSVSPDHSAYIGLFDDQDGLFFSYDSVNGVGVNLRKEGTTTTILQADWNIDPMDGSGKSGLDLDFTKTQLFVIDFEWLGVGRIRYGFYAFGQIFYCHQILNINQLTEAYIINPNLPIRYQLVGRNGTPNSATLTQICSSIISEGGFNPTGRPFAISRTETTSVPSKTETPVIAIRYRSTALHENIIPSASSIICTSNDIVIYRFRIFLAPNSPGTATWTPVDNNSLIEYTTSFSSYPTANSIVLDEGYIVGKGSSTYVTLGQVFKLVQLTANVDNVSDILVLSVYNPNMSALSVFGGINWQEAY